MLCGQCAYNTYNVLGKVGRPYFLADGGNQLGMKHRLHTLDEPGRRLCDRNKDPHRRHQGRLAASGGPPLRMPARTVGSHPNWSSRLA